MDKTAKARKACCQLYCHEPKNTGRCIGFGDGFFSRGQFIFTHRFFQLGAAPWIPRSSGRAGWRGPYFLILCVDCFDCIMCCLGSTGLVRYPNVLVLFLKFDFECIPNDVWTPHGARDMITFVKHVFVVEIVRAYNDSGQER